jgi:rhamnogalacturonyl hydrolase YesR
VQGTGGAIASGGSFATSSGGATSAGGNTKPVTGGSSAAGSSAGGTSSLGGTSGTGGTNGTGGATGSTGGATKLGGSSASGGSSAGGAPGTGGGTGSGGGAVTGLPAASAILASMRSANSWFTTAHPNAGAAINSSHAANLWTRAVYFEGLMGLYDVETDATRKTSYHTYIVNWGSTFSWQLYGNNTSGEPNSMCCGQTYIDIYNVDKDPTEIGSITTAVNNLKKVQPASGSANAWWWVDAIQMAMPNFAKLGVLNNDTTYFDAMWAMYNDARTKEGGGLWSAADGLWWRDKNFTPTGVAKPTIAPNGKSVYWARGNGWAFAALARVLDILPTTDAHRATYVSDFQAMAKALIAIQRTDGFWNESLFDPTQCSSTGFAGQDGPETSGTSLFTYGLAWGIRKGLLDSATYAPAVQKAWNGLSTVALQSNGLLGYVQSTGSAPCSDTSALGPTKLADYDDYGVGGFLLAGSQVYQLAGN